RFKLYQAFQTADGWINIGAANQSNWEKLVNLIDAEELMEDPRFVTNADRMENRLELEAELNTVISKRSTDEWLAIFEEGGLPSGPVLSIIEMHKDPQAISRKMVPKVDHPIAGEVQTIGLPVKFSETPGDIASAAPLLGQHTVEVLMEAGYSEQEAQELLVSGAGIQHKAQ
ncbi:MAG: CoA transferase, partial [Pseudomonadota bacterium]